MNVRNHCAKSKFQMEHLIDSDDDSEMTPILYANVQVRRKQIL